jgi:hypothetical protein
VIRIPTDLLGPAKATSEQISQQLLSHIKTIRSRRAYRIPTYARRGRMGAPSVAYPFDFLAGL